MSASDMTRVRMPRGLNKRSCKHIAIETARHPMDDDAQQEVAGVAVAPTRAGRKVERLFRGHPDELLFGIIFPQVDHRVGIVRNARGMREQMAHPDAVPSALSFRKPPGNPLVEAEPALLGQHSHGRGGELLSQRAGLIHGTVGCRNPVLEVGKAEAPREQNAVTTHDGDGKPGIF